MNRKSKFFFRQIVVWCTVFAFVLSFLPGYVLAAEEPAVTLEKAVQTAKTAFEIPQDFKTFSSGYNQYGEKQVWQLLWKAENEPRGNLNVQVDCQTAEILNMSLWQSKAENASQSKLPAVSRNEAVKIAAELVKKLQPQRMAEIKLAENHDELLPLTMWGPTSYSIKWVRQVQGIPFPQDGITVNVDNQSGRIIGYSFNWTAGNFPNNTKAISLQKARESWEKAEMLQLQYYYINPEVPKVEQKGERKVILVYRLVHPSAGTLDALTGQPLEYNSLMGIPERNSALQKTMRDEAADVALTPEEISEIEAAGKVISQKEAEAVVRKWVSLPQNFTLQNVRLNKDEWREHDARTWHLTWQNKGTTETEGEARWLEASVDAVNGVLLSFNWQKTISRDVTQQNNRLNREQAQKKAEEFLCKIQPALFKQIKLNDLQVTEPPRPLTLEELPNSQYFTYERIVNEIVFPTNGISVTIDANTGEISSYSLNWQELQFPAPEGLFEPSQINEQYLTRQPLTLQYIEREAPVQAKDLVLLPPGDVNKDKEIRLVYCPVLAPGHKSEAMCDAKTGAALDWQGKPLAKKPHSFNYTDISGHWAEEEIALLGQAGILGVDSSSFNPEKSITAVEYLRALLMFNRDVEQVYTLSDHEVIEQATKNGWVKEKLAADVTIDRLMLARLGIRFLGLEQVAQIEGIYTAPYQDLSRISSDEQGYVALAWGLGILKGEQDSFNPEQIVTRAEAAVTLVRLLKIQL